MRWRIWQPLERISSVEIIDPAAKEVELRSSGEFKLEGSGYGGSGGVRSAVVRVLDLPPMLRLRSPYQDLAVAMEAANLAPPLSFRLRPQRQRSAAAIF